jgi:zinc D-Ala-D-Ala carboxypeptidase
MIRAVMRWRRVVPPWVVLALLLAACGPSQLAPSAITATSVEPTATATPAPTPDRMAPAITGWDPGPGGVAHLSGAMRVTFTEPVVGVDVARFQMRDASGAVLKATVRLDANGAGATLLPTGPLIFAASYTLSLAGSIDDLAGNPLPPATWSVTASSAVGFAAGTYTGYRFGATPSHLVSLKRATLGTGSVSSGSEYRVIGTQGYLLIDAGIWKGLWVHGDATGTAQDDATAPISPLPACDYVDLPTARAGVDSWATTVLDTVFMLPSGYRPTDLVDTAGAGLNSGFLIRAIALDDLSAMVAAAKADGAQLEIQSSYRSYASQVFTFNGWTSQVGYGGALRVSARPGHSEHQLGTAIDFRSVGGPSPFSVADWAQTREGAWLAANAWRFGWIMSYPKGTAARSCYEYEPWHYRYYGRQIAKAIHDSGLTAREWLWSQGYGVR